MLDLQDAKVRALAKTIGTIWNNQVELSKSIDRVEEEFCVLGRLMIPKVNEMLTDSGGEDLITEETIQNVFLTWHEFKQRPDFKEHFVPWFLGVSLDELPPAPEVKEEEQTPDTPAPEGEGAEEFGGDYSNEGQTSTIGNETTPEGEPKSDEGGAENALSEGQDSDGTISGEGRDERSKMPQVPDSV